MLPKKFKFTDIAIQNLKVPERGQTEYWDTSLVGFGARASYGGTKTFFVMLDRKRRSLGKYPMVSLKDARGAARTILADPAAVRRAEQTLEVAYLEAVEQYLRVKRTELSENTWDWYARFLKRFNFSGLVSEIRAYEIEDALGRIKGQSNRSHGYTVLKIFFGWCLAREYCQVNPMQHLKKPKVPSSRERVLDDDELVAIWRACDELEKYGAIVKVLMLTGQRRGQIDRLQASWVDEEGITFPATVMKNKLEHWCPIGSLTRYVLMSVLPVGGYYFSPVTAVGRPFTAWSKNKRKLDAMVQLDPWTLHDLRRTWASNAPRVDIPPHITSRILSHAAPEGRISKIYNRYKYRGEMADAMDKMNDHILSLVADDDT